MDRNAVLRLQECNGVVKSSHHRKEGVNVIERGLSMITVLLAMIILVNSGIASAHTLYIVTEPKSTLQMEQEVVIAYGHPEASWANRRSYEIWNATLRKPDGSTVELDLNELDVIVGVAKMAEYWKANVKLD